MMYTILLFPNGNASVQSGDKILSELCHPWFLEYVKSLEALGIDPTDCEFRLPVLGLDNVTEVFKLEEGGWSWRFESKPLT